MLVKKEYRSRSRSKRINRIAVASQSQTLLGRGFYKRVLVLIVLVKVSGAAAVTPKVATTTKSVCDSQECSSLQITTGPWGGDQTQLVHMHCEVTVKVSKNVGDLFVLLSLDRDTNVVKPHTMGLVQNLPDGLRFTFSNIWIVPAGSFIFDFELAYDIDQGNTAIPGGYCTITEAVPTPTTISSTTPPTTTVASSPPPNAKSSTTAASTATTTQSISLTTGITTTTQSSSNTKDSRTGNIFSRVLDGYVYSILLVTAIIFVLVVLLVILRCCLYRYAFKRGSLNRVEDETKNMERMITKASDFYVPVSTVRTPGFRLIPHKGSKVSGIGSTHLDF